MYLIKGETDHQPGWMHETSAQAGALGRPRGMGSGGRWEVGSGWGIHVNPWLIHVNVWQKSLQHCKVISLQLIKINGKKFLKGINEEEIENMNRPITSNGIEDMINNALTTKSPQRDGFRVGIYQTFREELTPILKRFFPL